MAEPVPSTSDHGFPHPPAALPPGPGPLAANQFSGIYILVPTLRHDVLIEQTTPPTLVNRKIPNPIYRTHFIGDR